MPRVGVRCTGFPSEPLEENQIIEPSLEFHVPEVFIKDLISVTQYPQDEFSPIAPIEDLFPEISDPFFHYVDPVDIYQPHKVNLISLYLMPEPFSYILLFLVNLEPFSYFLSCSTNPELVSYFLPFLESAHISRTIRLHFVEITKLYKSLEPIPFATYFWYTL